MSQSRVSTALPTAAAWRWATDTGWVAVGLALLTLATRLPFLFDAALNWDESTFILVGQSIVDGHLPYTQLWDVKPPLLFAFFAIPIALFGKSIVAIRLVGVAVVAATALLVYLVGRRLRDPESGLVAAVVWVLAAATLPQAQSVLSETIAMPPLVGALLLLSSRSPSPATAWWAGVLLALACFVRLNLAYVAIVVGVAVLASPRPWHARAALVHGVAYALGGLGVAFLVLLPYLLAGEVPLFWSAVVVASLGYATEQQPVSVTVVTLLKLAFGLRPGKPLQMGLFWLGWLLFVAGGAGVAWFLLGGRGTSPPRPEDGRARLLLAVFTLGTALSIALSGIAQGHYLVQIAPFLALGTGLLFGSVPAGHGRTLALGALGLLMALAAWPLARPAYHLARAVIAGEAVVGVGPAYDIAAYLAEHDACRRPVLMFEDHVVWWLAGLVPPHKILAHSSNFSKPFLVRAAIGPEATPESTLTLILEARPAFVIARDRIYYMQGKAIDDILRRTLARDYHLVHQVQDQKIYRANDAAPCAAPAPPS